MMAKTVFLILISVCSCYMSCISTTMYLFTKIELRKHDVTSDVIFVYFLTSGIVYLNSFMNAMIFILRNRATRATMRTFENGFLPGNELNIDLNNCRMRHHPH